MTVRLRHLQEGINFADSRNKVWDERPDFGVKVDLLRFVSVDVFKKFFYLRRNGQIYKLSGIIGTWYFALIIVIGVRVGWCGGLFVHDLLGLAFFWLGLLVLLLRLYVHLNVHFVILFFRFNFLTVIDIYDQIERLVLNFFRFHVLGFGDLVSSILSLALRGCLLWLLRGLFIRDIFVLLFFRVILSTLSKAIVVAIHVYLNLNNLLPNLNRYSTKRGAHRGARTLDH